MTQFYDYVTAKMARADTTEALELERSGFLVTLESLLSDEVITRPDFEKERADVEKAYSERLVALAPKSLLVEFKEALESVFVNHSGIQNDAIRCHDFTAYTKSGLLYINIADLVKVGPVTSITVVDGTVYGQQHVGHGFANVFEVKGND